MSITIREYALLYASFAKQILLSGLPNSFDVLKSATRRYGFERGMRMARRAKLAGDGSDFIAFLAYTDWRPDPYSGFVAEVLEKFPVYTIEVSSCAWYDTWKENELDEYCRTYCQVFEPALVQGFNLDLDFQLPRAIGLGSSNCIFIYNGLPLSLESFRRLTAMQDRLGNSCVYSWEYLTAHMYSTMAQELIRIVGQEKGSVLVKAVLQQFGYASSTDDVKTLLGYEGTDFLNVERYSTLRRR